MHQEQVPARICAAIRPVTHIFDALLFYRLGTPSDAESPVGLQWFRVKQSSAEAEKANDVDYSQPLDTNLLCSACIPGVNECLNLGVCIGVSCTCLDGFYGDLCEENLSCFEFGCYANGSCNNVTGTCTCAQGFAGNLCQINTTQRLL